MMSVLQNQSSRQILLVLNYCSYSLTKGFLVQWMMTKQSRQSQKMMMRKVRNDLVNWSSEQGLMMMKRRMTHKKDNLMISIGV